MRWPLFWRPQVDEPLYDIRIVSWQVWNVSFFLNTSGRSKILDLQKETLMWHANFRTHAQLLGDCGQLTSKDEGPTAVVIRCVFVVGEKQIGHVRWELSMIVSATSRSPARKRTLGYEKKTKKMLLRNVGVSKNRGTPKSSILIGFSIIFTIHFGVPLFLETPMYSSTATGFSVSTSWTSLQPRPMSCCPVVRKLLLIV